MRKVIIVLSTIIIFAVLGWVAYIVLSKPMPPTQDSTQPPTQGIDTTKPGPLDADYVKKMLVQDQQAIEIADIVLASSTSVPLRQLMQDIKVSRTSEVALFKEWLAEWNEIYSNLSDFPQVSGHDLYPTLLGMTTPEQLQQLRDMGGQSLDQEAIKIMIGLTEGSLQMIDESRDVAQFGKLKDLLGKMRAERDQTLSALKNL